MDTTVAPDAREQPVGVFEPGEHVAVGLDLYRVVSQQRRASVLRRVGDGVELTLRGDAPVCGVFVSEP